MGKIKTNKTDRTNRINSKKRNNSLGVNKIGKNERGSKKPTFKPAFLKGLDRDGMIIIDGIDKASESVYSDLINKKSLTKTIFQNPGVRNDFKRKQMRLNKNRTKKNTREYLEYIEYLMSIIFPNHTPSKWSLIYSKEGCQEQAAHWDYDPESMKDVPDEDKPLAIIVPIEDGTTLNAWIGSNKIFSNKKMIPKKVCNINPGNVLVFRGDLIHAGSAYQKDNVRLHLYLDSNKIKSPFNSTWLVKDNDEIENMILD